MKLSPPPGLWSDATVVDDPPRWRTGWNVRWRNGRAQTMGLYRPLRVLGGGPVTVPIDSKGPARLVLIASRADKAQVLIGTLNGLFVLEPDAGSTLSTGTRWMLSDITPAGLATLTDPITPSLGRVKNAPFWFAVVLGNAIFVARGGQNEVPFIWDRDPAHVATAITGAPKYAIGGFVTDDKHLVLLGCESPDVTQQHELTFRWADQASYDGWPITTVGSAGDGQVTGCSRLVGGGWTSFGGAMWTDNQLWFLKPTGELENVMSWSIESPDGGLLAPNLWCEHGGALWWIAQDVTLRRYQGGTVETIPCTVARETLEIISRESAHRAFMHSVGQFGEIWIWCPNGEGQEADVAAVWSDRERCWTIAREQRRCMCDRIGVLRPLAIDQSGQVLEHEAAIVDDTPSWANDQPLTRTWSLRSSLFVPPIQAPEVESAEVYRIIADLFRTSIPGDEGAVTTITIWAYDWFRRNITRRAAAAYNWVTATDEQGTRLGGHSFELQMEGNDRTETRIGDIWLAMKETPAERK